MYQRFKERLQTGSQRPGVCDGKSRENKKGMIQITLHRKLQSKFRVIHSKFRDSECFQETFCNHLLT